jgi:hypothetical protein
MKKRICNFKLVAMLALAGLLSAAQAQGPSRLTHSEVKNMIERIEKNTDQLRSSIDASLDRSRYDGRRAEDNINQFVKDFESAADRLKERFSDENAAVGAAEEVLRRGAAIGLFLQRHRLSQRVERDWRNLYRDLNGLARAYHVGFNWTSPEMAPYRVSNEEIKRLIEWTEKRADSFRASLDEALDKSHFDATRHEDDINRFVRDFEVATDNLRERFADNYSASGAVSEVLKRGAVIDRFMLRHTLTSRAQNDWRLLRDNLDELSRAYNMSMSWKDWKITII